MLTLYYSPACPFCQRVTQVAENLKVNLELKDTDDQLVHDELVKKGGKSQVPYLVDSEKDVAMYESTDIIDYLRENHAGQTAADSPVSKPRIHVGSAVCESCEG
jgi:glutathione S-transferase